MENQVQECARLIQDSKSIAALTGAGISTSAGIPDFRGPKGLYVTRQYDPEKVFDIGYFYKDPEPFYEFARDFIGLEEKIQPTISHHFLSALEQQGKLKGIITQNIDCLHQRAGSENVFEMHGSIAKSYCLQCQNEFSYEQMKQRLKEEDVAHCTCGGVIKPDIVFFGENVKYLSESEDLASKVDLFFVIGTSCVVYPAAMIPDYVNGKIVIVNMDEVGLNSTNVVLKVEDDIDQFFSKVEQQL
jgi:NAD-dependent deacetylase